MKTYREKVKDHMPQITLKKTSEVLNNEDLKRIRYCLGVLIEEVELWSSDKMVTVPLRKMKEIIG